MGIKENLGKLREEVKVKSGRCQIVAVSKTKPVAAIMEAYEGGQTEFGENKVQEMVGKHETAPDDIKWHMIGHLQRNKVKHIAPFVHLIQSVDSLRLLQEIDKQAAKVNRVIDCLLQVHIAEEETKFGFSEDELKDLFDRQALAGFDHVMIKGLMGMATFTEDEDQVRKEFRNLKRIFNEMKSKAHFPNVDLQELSMGMSGDYPIAVEEGSTIIRVGSAIFGKRNYNRD